MIQRSASSSRGMLISFNAKWLILKYSGPPQHQVGVQFCLDQFYWNTNSQLLYFPTWLPVFQWIVLQAVKLLLPYQFESLFRQSSVINSNIVNDTLEEHIRNFISRKRYLIRIGAPFTPKSPL